ncbi:MAG: peptidylprolyl isomerase [Thermoleophilia bacterium]|nr:peptidylprolyl isomerase [Thermoleophilia bacterium]
MRHATRLTLALLALTAVLVAAGCGGNDDELPTGAVAVVDGVTVTKAELDSLLTRAKLSYEQQQRDFPKAGTPEYQSLQTQAVAYLVQRVEYDLEAEKMGVTVADAEIDERIADVKKQSFDGDDEQWQKALEEQGYTEDEVRAEIRSQLLSEKLVKEVSGDTAVTDADISEYYAANKAQFTVPETREVRHILVKTKVEADKIYAELEGGADFAALAKKYSEDPGSKDNGGKLTIAQGQTVEAFDKTAFLLKVGVLSRPVKTEYGYHLIEPIGPVKPGKVTPLAEAKAQIKSQLEQTKQNDAVTNWANELAKAYEGKTTYATGYAPPDTGATGTGTGG